MARLVCMECVARLVCMECVARLVQRLGVQGLPCGKPERLRPLIGQPSEPALPIVTQMVGVPSRQAIWIDNDSL